MTKEKISIIADWLLTQGYNETEDGAWSIDFETVAEYFEEPLEEVTKHAQEIAEIIDQDENIRCPTQTDENFDLVFFV